MNIKWKERKTMRKLLQIRTLLTLILVLTMVFAGCGKKDVVEEVYDPGKPAESDQVEESKETEEKKEEEQVKAPKTEYPFTFTDKFGNAITIEEEPAAIVSFAPEITETLFEMNVGDRMVGRSSWCDYPLEAFDVEDLGSLFDFNLEALLAVEPDVVFLSSMVSEEIYQQLVDNGLTVASFDFDSTLVGTMDQIKLIGNIVNKNGRAQKINTRIADALEKMKEKAATREPKSVYYAVAVGEYTAAATGDTFINDIITATGAENAAADGSDWMYTVEQLVVKDPDYIICSNKHDTKDKIMTLDGYKDLTAVKEGRLFDVDENIFSRQGPRVVDAMAVIDAIIYQGK